MYGESRGGKGNLRGFKLRHQSEIQLLVEFEKIPVVGRVIPVQNKNADRRFIDITKINSRRIIALHSFMIAKCFTYDRQRSFYFINGRPDGSCITTLWRIFGRRAMFSMSILASSSFGIET